MTHRKQVFVGLIALTVFISGCTDPVTTKRVLRQQGYSRIYITGFEFWGCSEDDVFHTGFEAISPSGTRVYGIVCNGYMKAATVRFK